MDFNEYQKAAASTAIYPEEYKIIYTALGLASEAGEVCGKVKKVLRDNSGVFTEEKKQAIADEVSDCQWYVSNLLKDLDMSLDEAAKKNIAKLKSRQERGKLQGSGDDR